MTITAAALISTLASQTSSSANRQSVATPPVPQRPSLADTATISALATATGTPSPTGLGSTAGVSSTPYDFTNMTNAQAVAAAQKLGNDGKITPDAEINLMRTASNGGNDSIPSNPGSLSTWVADSLSSSSTSDFIKTTQSFLSYDNYTHNAKAATIDGALLQDLESYQSTTDSSMASSSTIGRNISTTA